LHKFRFFNRLNRAQLANRDVARHAQQARQHRARRALDSQPAARFARVLRTALDNNNGNHMNLELNGDAFAQNATEDDLTRCLDSFFSAAHDSFVILSDKQGFVQVAKNKSGEFILERQDGSTEKHFRCSKENLSQQNIRATFSRFLVKGEALASELPWERVILDDDSESEPGTPLTLKHMIVLLVIVAAFLVYSLIKTFV
jgi:hypothetical protein